MTTVMEVVRKQQQMLGNALSMAQQTKHTALYLRRNQGVVVCSFVCSQHFRIKTQGTNQKKWFEMK